MERNRVGNSAPRNNIGDDEPWAVIPFIYHDDDYPGQKDNFVKTTRYTILSFIPLTLYENFRNLTNIYFLIILIVSFFPYSPVSFIFNLNPLLFVLICSMIKSGIEDGLKAKQDKISNNIPVKIYNYGEWVDKPSKDIHVGDIIMVKSEQTIPADIFYLTSSNKNKICYYSETNLNGESAVKTMSQHKAFKDANVPSCFNKSQYYISVGPPSNDLYKFNAKLSMKRSKWPISIKNILLKGCTLHFTDWIIGVAVRTGHDCTIMKNRRKPPAKITLFDKNINKMILVIFFIKMIFVSTLSIANMLIERNMPLIALVRDSNTISFAKGFMQYFVLFSYMIPISMIVTIEIIRMFHMVLIHYDEQLSEEEYGNSELNNSNMITSLAAVTHVLSDKTGTLTENVMHLTNFVDLNGATEANSFLDYIKVDDSVIDDSIDLFRAMTICNTVIVYHNPNGETEYNSESPDESCFVQYTDQVGIRLESREPSQIFIDNRGVSEIYDVISMIPFDSDRKRMTIVVRKRGSENLVVYSKGADSVMYSLSNRIIFNQEVNDYAISGLRTLVFCKRVLTKEEADKWIEMYTEAELNIENREDEIMKIAPFIESNLNVIGVTAVEDKLQDEVPESIEWMRQANISFWMLTGDKLETAIEIGKTADVIIPNADALILAHENITDFVDQLKRYLDEFYIFNEPVLVLTAETTKYAFENEELFMELAMKCRSVIFSRVSPFMKANIVRLVKEQPNTVTLAIGDGANDVGMIQEAHIGVGVKGREGCQASQSADFAIPRFRHLIRLLAVYGEWAQKRFNIVAIYMLYKNFVFILIVLFCAFDTKASPPDFYNEFYISTFNLIFTIIPPFAYGFFEQNIPQDLLIKYPQLKCSLRSPLSIYSLLYYLIISIYQSLIIYITIRFSHSDEPFELTGNLCFYSVVYVVTFQLMSWTKYYNVFVVSGYVLTFLLLHIFTYVYSVVIFPEYATSTLNIYKKPKSIFAIILAVIFALMPPFVFEYFQNQINPSLERLLVEKFSTEKKKIENSDDKESDPNITMVRLPTVDKFDVDLTQLTNSTQSLSIVNESEEEDIRISDSYEEEEDGIELSDRNFDDDDEKSDISISNTSS